MFTCELNIVQYGVLVSLLDSSGVGGGGEGFGEGV